MTDETRTEPAHGPGPAEAAALEAMHGIAFSTVTPSRHVVAHQTGPGCFTAHAWDGAERAWRAERGATNLARATMLAYLADLCPHVNVAITDQRLDFASLDGTARELLDKSLQAVRTTLCPEGMPGRPDGWCAVESCVGGGKLALSNGVRFWPVQLRERFLAAATPAQPERWLPGVQPMAHRAVLVRHDETARELLHPSLWGIEGRPDLLGRQIDREHAITAETWAEAERRTKAGDTTSIEHIHHEVAVRMQREWDRAA